jgi:hypothetical protein
MSYIILEGRWCDITVRNLHVPGEDKTDDKGQLLRGIKECKNQFRKFHVNILLGDFNAKADKGNIFKLEI